MAKVNVCSVEGCDKTTRNYAHMCGMHRTRQTRRGDVNFERVRRVVTETEAWCNKGQHMVPHDGFAKNQRMCKQCRKVYSENNYSLGVVLHEVAVTGHESSSRSKRLGS